MNANIIERLVVPVMLPEDALYSPSLEITVVNRRFGGDSSKLFSIGKLLGGDALIGTAALDLSTRTVESRRKPNPHYRGPGMSRNSAELEVVSEGENPFMASGASKEMRDAFKKRSSHRTRDRDPKSAAEMSLEKDDDDDDDSDDDEDDDKKAIANDEDEDEDEDEASCVGH